MSLFGHFRGTRRFGTVDGTWLFGSSIGCDLDTLTMHTQAGLLQNNNAKISVDS